MVLEVEADTWKIHQRLDSDLAELFWITDTRPLEDQRGAESATADDDHLPGFVNGRLVLPRVQGLGGHCLDAHCDTIFNNDFVHLGVTLQVQIVIFRPGGMNIGMSSVTTAARVAVDPFQPMLCAMAAVC